MNDKETLEEAILRIKSENEHYIDEIAFELGTKWQQEQEKITTDDAYNEGFENGKHWQQERGYSEEEVLDLLFDFQIHRNDLENCVEAREWFEQFKKK